MLISRFWCNGCDTINFLGYKRTKPFIVFADGHTSVHSFLLFTPELWATLVFKFINLLAIFITKKYIINKQKVTTIYRVALYCFIQLAPGKVLFGAAHIPCPLPYFQSFPTPPGAKSHFHCFRLGICTCKSWVTLNNN